MEKVSSYRKKFYFFAGLAVNIGLLVFFKYINFLLTLVWGVLHFSDHTNNSSGHPLYIKLIEPLGISYIAFQTISYLIEINRGDYKAEKKIGIFASYLLFFPKILSGPIERAHNFISQLYEKKYFNYIEVTNGLKLFIWGFFKKVVIANRIAILTDPIFNNVPQYTGIPLILSVFLFTFQLYADFSGYTDMAIGCAQMLGFKLTNNFNAPFIAKSTAELWRRWHISLSTWFSDYIYNPIVTFKRNWNNWAVVYALIITFILLGLWHGASWNFVIFGFIQGIVLSIEFLTKKIRKKIWGKLPSYLNNALGIIYVLSIFSFSLIFFRTKNINDAFYIISHSLNVTFHIGMPHKEVAISLILIIFLFSVQFLQTKIKIIETINRENIFIRWSLYYLIIFLIFFLGVYTNNRFIYFQF